MKKRWITLAALALSLFPLQAQESESTAPRILGFDCSESYGLTYKSVRSLDVSGCTALTSLKCPYNGLTSLDVSGCTALQYLDCSYNEHLTSMNVNGCTALQYLDCSYNERLKSMNVNGCTALKYLDCSYDKLLKSLNVRGYTALQYLNCKANQLAGLDVSGCTALMYLNCSDNKLEMFDLSQDTALTSLICWGNHLRSLDVSRCTILDSLFCSGNSLTGLDVSACTSLTDLRCNENGITSLDVSGCTALTNLYCAQNCLTNLDVSGCTALTYLNCYSNGLTNLDVSSCTALTYLYCNNNRLTNLDVSSCTALTYLNCQNNRLTSLDIEKTSLGELSCGVNRIPLSMLYKEHCRVSGNQSDSIVLQVGETFDLSSERIVGQVLSTYKVADAYGREVDSSVWEENQFEFQFHTPLFYTLELQNPKIGGRATFTWHISVEEVQYYTVKVMSSNTEWGTVSVTGNGTYEEGGEVAITAQSYEGYRFVNWTKADGAVFSTEAFYTFTADENLELTANFEKEPNDKETFTVTLVSNNTEWGRVSMTGNGTYEKDETVTITATPNEGYHFVNWTKADGAVFSTKATHMFVVTDNLELTAHFEKIPGEVGNEAPDKDNFRIYAQDRVIYLSADRGGAEVYNALGQCVYNGHATAIPVRNGGLYIVRVGRNGYKVKVR